MPDLHLRLIVDVTYDTNGVGSDELGQNLQDMVRFAMGDGLVTGESAAEVETWKTKVEQVKDAEVAGYSVIHIPTATSYLWFVIVTLTDIVGCVKCDIACKHFDWMGGVGNTEKRRQIEATIREAYATIG